MLQKRYLFVLYIETDEMSNKTLITAFNRWRNRFLRQAMRFLPSEEDAEDVLQDAFVKLWMKADDIESENDALALTSVTVRNMAIDRYRSNKRYTIVDLNGNEIEDDLDKGYVETEEKLIAVNQIIGQCLTNTQQQIIRLREHENKSFDEIGKMLKMQPTAVRMQLSRARKAIREEYRKRHIDE